MEIWTKRPEVASFYEYVNEDNGEFFINEDDYKKNFSCTIINHIFFNTFQKTFHFDNKDSFKYGSAFSLYLEKDTTVSLGLIMRNWRYNREIPMYANRPLFLIVAKYDDVTRRVEKVFYKSNYYEDLFFIEDLEAGDYCVYFYVLYDAIKGDDNFKLKFKCYSNNEVGLRMIGYDINFDLLRCIALQNYKNEFRTKILWDSCYTHMLSADTMQYNQNNLFLYIMNNKTNQVMNVDVDITGTNLKVISDKKNYTLQPGVPGICIGFLENEDAIENTETFKKYNIKQNVTFNPLSSGINLLKESKGGYYDYLGKMVDFEGEKDIVTIIEEIKKEYEEGKKQRKYPPQISTAIFYPEKKTKEIEQFMKKDNEASKTTNAQITRKNEIEEKKKKFKKAENVKSINEEVICDEETTKEKLQEKYGKQMKFLNDYFVSQNASNSIYLEKITITKENYLKIAIGQADKTTHELIELAPY